jgi:hypothetical protein
MLKQNSRVYQRYPGLKGDVATIPGLVGMYHESPSLCSSIKKELTYLNRFYLVPLGIFSIMFMVAFPISLAFFPHITFLWPAWILPLGMLFLWFLPICCNHRKFLYAYIVFALPFFPLYVFGLLWQAGIIADWSGYIICIPLYFLSITVPVSGFMCYRQLKHPSGPVKT